MSVASALRWRAAGLVGAKAIALGRTVLVARLLSPDDFGLFALAVVPLDLLLGMTDVGIGKALVRDRDATDATYHVAWTVGLLRGLGVGLLLLLAAPLLAAALGEPRATGVVRAMAIGPVLASLASARTAALERALRHRPLAIADLVAATAGAVAALVLAPTRGVWALVAGSLVAAAVGAAASYVIAPAWPRVALDRARATELLRFGRWILLSTILALAGEAVLRGILARALGGAALGRYALAASLAWAPGGLLAALTGAITYALHARGDGGADGRVVFQRSLAMSAAVLLPIYAILFAVADALVTHALGPRWAGTASAIRLLSLVSVLAILYEVTAPLLRGRGSPRAVTALDASFAVTAAVLAWPLARVAGLDGGIGARVLAEVLVAAGCVALLRRALVAPFEGLGAVSIVALGASAAGAIVTHLAARALAGAAGVAGAAAAGGVAALVVGWALDRRLGQGLAAMFVRLLPARE